MSHHGDHGSENDYERKFDLHHILSKATSRNTLVTLLVLTIITVGASRIDLGQSLNFALAMFIATIKAMVVTLFFMGLKYDYKENRGIFYSAAFFVLAFIALTAQDIFTRRAGWQIGKNEVFLQVANVGGPSFEKPYEKSEAILAHGKKLFETNCAVCHGVGGLGDGPGSALPVKPRNFTSGDGWKNTRRTSTIFKMLEVGVPPYMPPYAQLAPNDRWALAHYVLSFGPAPEADTQQTLAAVGFDPLKPAAAAAVKKTIPIDFAIDRYLKQ